MVEIWVRGGRAAVGNMVWRFLRYQAADGANHRARRDDALQTEFAQRGRDVTVGTYDFPIS